MKIMKILLFGIGMSSLLLMACGKTDVTEESEAVVEKNTETEDVDAVDTDMPENEETEKENGNTAQFPIILDLVNAAEGSMIYELEEAYITDNPDPDEINFDYLDPYSYAYLKNESGDVTELSYPDYFEDPETGKLVEGVHMYVCSIKVTNVDAVSVYESYFNDPYMFTAGNLYLKTGRNNEEYYGIGYYSLKKEGDHEAYTYKLMPGDSIEYQIGFVIGNVAFGENGYSDLIGDGSDLYLSMYGGRLEDGDIQIDWEIR